MTPALTTSEPDTTKHVAVRTHCLNCSYYMVDCHGCLVGQHECKRPYSLCKQEDTEATP